MKLNYLKMRLCRSSTTSCIEEQYICVCFKEESNLSGCQGSVGRSVQLWSPFLYSPTVHFFVDNESIFNWLFTCSFTRCTACGGHCCEITLRLVVCGGAAKRWGICVAITSAWTCDKEWVLERIKKKPLCVKQPCSARGWILPRWIPVIPVECSVMLPKVVCWSEQLDR